jgi:hypothetical protein
MNGYKVYNFKAGDIVINDSPNLVELDDLIIAEKKSDILCKVITKLELEIEKKEKIIDLLTSLAYKKDAKSPEAKNLIDNKAQNALDE